MTTDRGSGVRIRAGLLLAALVALACGGGAETTTAPPGAVVAVGRVRLEEMATIGCETCPPLEQLSVFTMAMDADGLIWTVDRYAPHMRVFRADGELAGAFGPDGEGPGDFTKGPMERMITGDAVLAVGGGRALVHQIFPPALVEFDVEGTLIRHLPILVPDALTQPAFVLMPDPTGPRAFALSERIGPAADGEPFIIHRFDIGEESVRRTEIVAGSELFPDAAREAIPNRLFGMAVAPDGTLAVGDSLTYEIIRLDGEGNVTGRFSHSVDRPLKGEEMLDAQRRAARRRGESEDDIDLHGMHFRRDSLEFDDRGRLWVAVERPTREQTVLDVFAPEGTFLQQLQVPYRIPRTGTGDAVIQLAGGYLSAVVSGPDDEHRIKVWRVVEE